jgi:drug/metabolite transporter superfamily protein YnfA
MNDERDVRCHEIRSHENKTFRLSRMESVEIIDVPWTFDDRHKQMYTGRSYRAYGGVWQRGVYSQN